MLACRSDRNQVEVACCQLFISGPSRRLSPTGARPRFQFGRYIPVACRHARPHPTSLRAAFESASQFGRSVGEAETGLPHLAWPSRSLGHLVGALRLACIRLRSLLRTSSPLASLLILWAWLRSASQIRPTSASHTAFRLELELIAAWR